MDEGLRFDVIFHLGACTDTTNLDAGYHIANNTLYTKSLFDYAIASKSRFLYASSGAVYGLAKTGFAEDQEILAPVNPYGYSKYLFDQWMLKSARKPVQCVGFRFFNVYGPGEYHKGGMASMVYRGFLQIKDHGSMGLFKGNYTRDFIYVRDAVDVMLYFFDHPRLQGLYNVGTGTTRPFEDLAQAIFTAMSKRPDITSISMPSELKKSYQSFTEADIRKLRVAGYKRGFTSLEHGVASYVEHLLKSFV